MSGLRGDVARKAPMTPKLDKLASDATQVGAEHDRLVRAISEEVAARAALLERMVQLVKPALTALGSPIQCVEKVSGLLVATKPQNLWLLTTGEFAKLTTGRPEVIKVAPEEVASASWDVTAIVGSVCRSTESHLGKREARTADTLDRAKKLRAILALLEAS